ncbi:MAG: DUF1772 domain-containing protein [Thermoleophilaceae bacterium]
MDAVLLVLTLAALVGAGAAGGALFAFSAFAMNGLRRLPAAQGIAAMQSINVAAISFAFMLALFGTLVASVALAVWALADLGESYAPYLLAGGVVYAVGVIGVTGAFNVPRNNALAALEASDAGAAGYWGRYLSEWTAWNHVRSVAGLAAAVLFGIGLHVG